MTIFRLGVRCAKSAVLLPVSDVLESMGVDHSVGGPDPLKICRRGQSMFWPPLNVAFFHSKLLDNSASFTSWRMKDLCQKWKVKPIFQGTWNSSMSWSDRPWPPPLFYVRCTALLESLCAARPNVRQLWRKERVCQSVSSSCSWVCLSLAGHCSAKLCCYWTLYSRPNTPPPLPNNDLTLACDHITDQFYSTIS